MCTSHSTFDVEQPETSLQRAAVDASPPHFYTPDKDEVPGRKTPTFEEQVGKLLGWAGSKCGLSSYVPRIGIAWNHRFTSVLGRATLREETIELASKLWPFLTEPEQRLVVIHEGCHLFAYHRYGKGIRPHGEEWQDLMVKCGYREPRASIPCPNSTAAKQYLVYCRCGSFFVSPQFLGRTRSGALYCPKCDSDIRMQPYD